MLFILEDGILFVLFQVQGQNAWVKTRGDRFLSESSAAELDYSCIVVEEEK